MKASSRPLGDPIVEPEPSTMKMQSARMAHEAHAAADTPLHGGSRSSHVSLVPEDPRSHTHDVRFYEGGRFPAEAAAAYLAPALDRDGTAIVVATAPHAAAIVQALETLGARPREAEASGRLVLLDATTTLAALEENGVLDRERFDALSLSLLRGKLGTSEIRTCGEGVDILCSQGRYEEALLLEKWWGELHAESGFGVLCIYQLDNFSDASTCAPFSRVCAAHDDVHTSDLDTTVAGSDPGRLRAHLEQRTRVLDGMLRNNPAAGSESSRPPAGETAGFGEDTAASRHLASLQRVSSALSVASTLRDVRRVTESVMVEALGASDARLAIASPGRELEVLAPEWPSNGGGEERRELELGLETVHRADTALWPRTMPGVVALPLTLGAGCTGAVAFAFADARPLAAPDRALIEDFARQLGLALDRALARELLHQECVRAEEANRAKDDFLAMLGHELRNPLAPMLTALELMRLRANSVAERERLVLERQVQHMIRLVDDLLDVSRITRGKVELSPKRIDLCAVVREALEHASPMFETRRHRVTIDVPQGLVVLADPHRLAQVVMNLLTNAAKYTPEQGLIEVFATRDAGSVRLAVKDNGVGIPPGLLPRLFDLFVQGPQSLDRSRGGLGLGLTLVRRLVEMHGGTVSAESDGPGHGSTFTIELPLIESALEAPRESKSRPTASPGPKDAVSILVVDDNVDAADMLAEVLRSSGHRVAIAYDGPSALTLLDEFEPELALLDIGLPVMDGFELAEKFRARLPSGSLLLVALTGYGQPSDRARAKAAGFDMHLVKPLDLKELEALVERARARRDQGAFLQ
ncbi:MAG TPA: ATP-binding protein [Polyangiaceae bacterium]|nr:ATP-binding protein [Polyangiaceae bacterium]